MKLGLHCDCENFADNMFEALVMDIKILARAPDRDCVCEQLDIGAVETMR